MSRKREIGYEAFHCNLWMVKASWLVATKTYEKQVILVLNLMVLLICLVYLWFLWENVWLCFLLLWQSFVSHLLEFSAITLTFHCHVAIWEIPCHQCFTTQLIDASLPMHCKDPHAHLQHVLTWGFALLPLDKNFDSPLCSTLRFCEHWLAFMVLTILAWIWVIVLWIYG